MHSPTMTAIKWWPGDCEYAPSSPKDSRIALTVMASRPQTESLF